MYRQSPSRNQRSKGIKVKYIVQICLLLAVCFWLIYQVKHSHDKKREFEESDAKASLGIKNSDEEKPINLGRKGALPRDGETISKNDKKPIVEDETVEEEEDETKPEEEDETKPEEEDNNKPEEDEPEEKNVEHDAEVDREEDSADENENQEVGLEDGHGQTEIEGSSDGDENKSVNEAREEHYKADDASSAVTHDNTENENVNEEDKKENKTEETDKSKVTTGETKVDVLDGSENGLLPNNTVIEGSDRDLMSNNSTEVKIETGANVLDSNSTETAETKDDELRSEDLSNSSNNNNNSTESLSSEKNDEIENEKSDTSDGTYGNAEITGTENPEEEIQQDGIDVSDTLEEKHVRTDLDTLPEIQTEGTNSEDDVAAE
ncbi:hypothetical protein PHJA_001010800 [Phtheirospermum japonicum]|uniref:Uncharacterized protein n=1 Tax=Phtheirospermum japonicum TaxID=374723 RepID=A0A830C326_9LAMI|nr:hypothetical protein PHJA_001010800 [Phtheirospermum japonicum]